MKSQLTVVYTEIPKLSLWGDLYEHLVVKAEQCKTWLASGAELGNTLGLSEICILGRHNSGLASTEVPGQY